MTVTHATFSLERTYPTPPARVFAAWADPARKARWFAGPDVQHHLDFRVGGRETVQAQHDGKALTFESVYCDIVADGRIVFSATLRADGRLATASITTVELAADPAGTRLVLTEQGTYLDNLELPEWREQGTATQLDQLAAVVAEART